MSINKRLKEIDDFFENLSIEEFDKKLEKAGINDTRISNDSSVELLLSSIYLTEQDLDVQYINKKEVLTEKKNYYNLYYGDYAEAV